MHRNCATVVLLILLFVPLGAHAQTAAVDTFLDASLAADNDNSGDITCGDTLTWVVSVTSGNGIDARDVIVQVDLDPELIMIAGSLSANNPNDPTTIYEGSALQDRRVHVRLGRVCATGNCFAPGASVIFQTRIMNPSPNTLVSQTAQVTGSNFTDRTASRTVRHEPCPPRTYADVALTKSDGGATAAPGDTIAYTLSFQNDGQADAINCVLYETVPEHTTFSPASSSPGWSCTGTAAGSTCSLTVGALIVGGNGSRVFAVTTPVPRPAGVTSTTNTASITTSSAEFNTANNTASDTTPLSAGSPDLAVVKTLASGSGSPGSLLIYTLDVQNRGNATATSASINESLPPHTTFDAASSSPGWACSGSSCFLGLSDLQPGASLARTFAVRVVNPVPAGATTIPNTACVANTTGDASAINDCSSTSTPLGGAPNLRVVKTLASGSGSPGALLTFTLTATNSGDRDAAGVVLTERVPEHTTFSPAQSSPGWSCSPSAAAGSTCTLSLGTLQGAGGSASRSFAVTVANPLPVGVTQISNTVCLDPSTCDTLTIPTNGAPSLSLVKTVASGQAAPGDLLVYRLQVANTGNQAAASVTITESLPPYGSFDAAASSPGWSCAASSCSIAVGDLAGGGATIARLFAVRLAPSFAADATTIDNTACARSGNLENCDTLTLPAQAEAVLSVVKTASASSAAAGSTLTYTLEVGNTGNKAAAGVVLTDVLPPGFAITAPAGWSCQDATCTMPIGGLAAGATVSRTLSVTLPPALPHGLESIDNLACAEDSQGQTACSRVSTPIVAAPVLTLTKNHSGGPLTAGLLVAFELTVRNTGDQDAAAVVLTETVPAGSTFEPSASPGWTCASPSPGSVCTLTLGDLAAGATREATFAVRAPSSLPHDLVQISNVACAQAGALEACGSASTPLPVFVSSTLTDQLATDVDVDGSPDPGDAILYTLVVTNTSSSPANLLRIIAALDPHLTYLGGSINATLGTVERGSNESATDFLVQLPTLQPGQSTTLTFRAGVGPLPADLAHLSTQGSTTGSNFNTEPTDDPDTTEPRDPTLTPLVHGPLAPEPAPIPAMGTVAMILLGSLFGLFGARRLF